MPSLVAAAGISAGLDLTTVAAVTAVASVASLVALVMLCAKGEKKRMVVAPQNTCDLQHNDNVTMSSKAAIGAPESVYDDAPTPPAGSTALKTKDWTSHIDTDTKGAARSVKKTKRQKKTTAKAAFEAPSDFGGFDDGEPALERKPSSYGFDDAVTDAADRPVPPPVAVENDPLTGFGDAESPAGFGAYDGMSGTAAAIHAPETGYDVAPPRQRKGTMAVVDPFSGEADGGGVDDEVPAWYAGKLSRALCEGAVTAAGVGDFLVRESSRGDRCVVCINDRGKAVNLVITITPQKKYRFAGKERDSLHDVIFFLRRKPLTSAVDGQAVELAMPAPKAAAQAKDAANHAELDEEYRLTEEARMREFAARGGDGGRAPPPVPEDLLGLIIGETGTDLYESVTIQGGVPVIDNPFADENGVEPLYVDMSDCNVPSFEFIAEREEEHRVEKAGHKRISNEEFAKMRKEAEGRAAAAAKVARAALIRKSVRYRYRTATGTGNARPARLLQDPHGLIKEDEPEEENFASYQDASMREFGGYEEDEIYESVPRWFAGRLDRKKCEDIIRRSVDGTYVCRESSSGDKYIICIKHSGVVKNFQVYIKGASMFEFSGRQYKSLDAVIKYCTEKGIMKNGERIPLTRVADW